MINTGLIYISEEKFLNSQGTETDDLTNYAWHLYWKRDLDDEKEGRIQFRSLAIVLAVAGIPMLKEYWYE